MNQSLLELIEYIQHPNIPAQDGNRNKSQSMDHRDQSLHWSRSCPQHPSSLCAPQEHPPDARTILTQFIEQCNTSVYFHVFYLT